MAYEKKTWVNREVEFPNRRNLVDVETGNRMVVDVSRNEGIITSNGDAFSAENMNGMEGRIEKAFLDFENYEFEQITIPINSSIGNTDNFIISFLKIGKLVQINIDYSGKLGGANVSINGLIPEKFRPTQVIFMTTRNVTIASYDEFYGDTRYKIEKNGNFTITDNYYNRFLERHATGFYIVD